MKRHVIALFLCGLSICALAFYGCTPEQTAPAPPVVDQPIHILPVDPPNCGPDCCPTELAGRYHGRKRTKRFFGRVS